MSWVVGTVERSQAALDLIFAMPRSSSLDSKFRPMTSDQLYPGAKSSAYFNFFNTVAIHPNGASARSHAASLNGQTAARP
jgi:hypothetical protein